MPVSKTASNDEAERRGASPVSIERHFIPIIDSLLGPPKTQPRDRSNRLLAVSTPQTSIVRNLDAKSGDGERRNQGLIESTEKDAAFGARVDTEIKNGG